MREDLTPRPPSPEGRGSFQSPMSGGGERRRKREDEFSPTYYGQPAVKHSHYRFLIISYFFVGGLTAAAQIIATIADLFGSQRDRTIVRSGRYIAFAGSLLCPALLVADLHTKQRWFNMMRIFRRTSPMSIGSWTLAGFGAFTGLATFGQVLEDVLGLGIGRLLARCAAVPAALFGLVMSCYTGVLLTATSTPLWAAAYPFLSPLFASSAVTTATAALSLAAEIGHAPASARRRLSRLATIAAAAEVLCTALVEWRWRRKGVVGPLDQPRYVLAYRGGVRTTGILLPLAAHLEQQITGRESRLTSILAAVATLIGGYCLRAVVILAGNKSADEPQDYFRFTESADGLLPAGVRDLPLAAPAAAPTSPQPVGARP